MEHLISVYYKEDHHHRIYYTILVPLEQKEKKEGEVGSEELDIPPAFSQFAGHPGCGVPIHGH